MFTFFTHSENLKSIVRYIVLYVKTPSWWLYISFIYLQKLNVFSIFSYCNHIKLWQLWYHKVFTTVEKTWISVQCVIWKYKFLPYGLYNWMDRIRYTAEILKNKAECIWCRLSQVMQWILYRDGLGQKRQTLLIWTRASPVHEFPSQWHCLENIVLYRLSTWMRWYNEFIQFHRPHVTFRHCC